LLRKGELQSAQAKSLPPLNALRAFDAFARCGSLRAAASDLGVVPGAVRQQLASLEDYFGFLLLSKQAGRITLNPAGRRLADAVGIAFAIVSRAAEEISSNSQVVRLRLGVPMPMATAWFIPRLPQMHHRSPTLEIDVVPVSVTQSLSDMPDIDAIIVGGEYKPLPDIAAITFMKDEFAPVAAPQTWGRVDLTLPLAMLESMKALIARNVPYLWDDWFREGGHAPARFNKRIEVEDLTLAISAAKAGLGVTIAPRASIEAELASGLLVAPFGFVTRPAGYRLCCRVADRDRRPIVALRSWLIDEGKTPADMEEKLPVQSV
jgi:DNA-binding transcriptional LysR family regulator